MLSDNILKFANDENEEVRQLIADVVKATETYEQEGKPDLSQRHCQLARDLHINDGEVVARWAQAKANWNKKLLAAQTKPSPKPKLEVVPNLIRSLAMAEPKAEPKPKSKPELEGLVGRIKLPGPEWALADLGPNYCPELSRKAPLDIAKRFTADKLTYHAKGRASQPGTFFYQDRWWQWNGAFYEKAPERRLIDMVCSFLDHPRSEVKRKVESCGGSDQHPEI